MLIGNSKCEKQKMSFLDLVEEKKFVIFLLLLLRLQTNICLRHPLAKCIFLYLLLLRKIWATVGERFLLFFFFKQHLFPFFSSRQNFGKRRFLFFFFSFFRRAKWSLLLPRRNLFSQLQYFSRTCLSVYIPEFFSLAALTQLRRGDHQSSSLEGKKERKYSPPKRGKTRVFLAFFEEKSPTVHC